MVTWNDFIDLQKLFTKVKSETTQSSEADLKYISGAAADITKTDAQYLCTTVLHPLLYDSTVSTNG